MSYMYSVIDGTKSRPAGRIGDYPTKREAQDARNRFCRMGGYIVREKASPTFDRYCIYLACADDGNGGDITRNGEPLLSFDEWLSR